MTTANLYVVQGGYYQPDSIRNTINYIYRKGSSRTKTIYCYGSQSHSKQELISTFYQAHNSHPYTSEYVVHFFISFPEDYERNADTYLFLDELAFAIGQKYPICYSEHNDTDHLHFHFIACCAGYFPGTPDLNSVLFSEYLEPFVATAAKFNIALTTGGK